jgi:hypothetical protein
MMPLLRSRIGARSTAVDVSDFMRANQRLIDLLLISLNRLSIVPLAVHCQDIARSAALHL